MANPTINWATKVITIPQSFLTYISGSLYELDVNGLRLTLKNIEDDENEGMAFPDIHRHNTQVTLSGVNYVRTFEIINGYTVTFENGQYAVRCVGANHNLADVRNLNQVSLIVGNSAGYVLVETDTSGLTETESQQLAKIEYVKAETDKIPLVKIETDKIPVVKTETDKISLIKIETDKIEEVRLNLIDVESLAVFIKEVEGGKWKIDGDQMIFYNEDNITEIMRFDIARDESNNPIMRTRV